jgi:radical SAM superfamily enzyme YgiQ (UPF0313 family)
MLLTDVLLVNAPVRDPGIDPHARASPPLGLASIAAVLESNGFSVHALDLNIAGLSDPAGIEEILVHHGPSLLGISSTTETYPNALEIARRARRIHEELFIVLGGPHVTALPFDTFKEPAVDAVAIREGEYTMGELASYVCHGIGELPSIRGLVFRDGTNIYQTQPRPLIDDLDSLPFPERRFFPMQRYAYPGTISSARGCPGKCIFCAADTVSGDHYRLRSPESFIAEVHHLVARYQIDSITIVDDTFTIFPKRLLRICELIKSHHLDIRWGCSTRADMVNVRLLKSMAEVGCQEIHFGVESGNDTILREIKKGIRREQVERSVEASQSAGMKVYCSFMLPHPGDTLDTLSETGSFIKTLVAKNVGVSVSITTPFPGTELWKNPGTFGVEITSTDWFDFDCCTPIIQTRHLKTRDIYKIVSDLSFKGINRSLGLED